jgi:pimeloyl-ACP methyl ester carboxylesterase
LARYLAKNGFFVASINLLMALPSGILTPDPHSAIQYLYIHPLITVLYNDLAGTVSIKSGLGFALQPWVSGTDFRIDRILSKPFRITFLRRYPEIHGLAPRGRADVIAQHLQVLQNKFGARISNSIGLIGHSRGGEAVVRVAATSGSPIKAIISLAPTDYYEVEKVSKNIPYFVLYGSRDGDVDGSLLPNREHNPNPPVPGGSGGFSLYDRSVNSSVKSMSFVYGATHNGFVTFNNDFAASAIPDRIQHSITRAYMHAFLRQHLLGEQIWKGYFTGEFIPPSTGYTEIYQQYREMIGGNFKIVDDFENSPHDWTQSSSAQAVNHSRAGTGLAEDSLHTLDNNSPHETSGLQIIDWNAGDRLTFAVLPVGFDVRPWTHLSFRVAQVVGKINSTVDTMKVALVDAGTQRHEVVVNKKVPDPDPRVDDPSLTKSALMTIRLPLADYANNVDLSKVASVQFVFPPTGAGNIQIDDLEFTK